MRGSELVRVSEEIHNCALIQTQSQQLSSQSHTQMSRLLLLSHMLIIIKEIIIKMRIEMKNNTREKEGKRTRKGGKYKWICANFDAVVWHYLNEVSVRSTGLEFIMMPSNMLIKL